MSLNGKPCLTGTQFGIESGLLLESDINSFFKELGETITEADSTFAIWQKENADQWQALLKKYL